MILRFYDFVVLCRRRLLRYTAKPAEVSDHQSLHTSFGNTGLNIFLTHTTIVVILTPMDLAIIGSRLVTLALMITAFTNVRTTCGQLLVKFSSNSSHIEDSVDTRDRTVSRDGFAIVFCV